MQSKHFGNLSNQNNVNQQLSSAFLFTGIQHDFTQIIKNKILTFNKCHFQIYQFFLSFKIIVP